MTDPETGHQMVLNIEGWMPSWGDLTEFAPEALGIAGGMGGAAIAGAAGTALSPIGAFAAGSAGGGVGYAAGKTPRSRSSTTGMETPTHVALRIRRLVLPVMLQSVQPVKVLAAWSLLVRVLLVSR